MALGVVIQIDGYDPVAAAPVSLRAGSHDVADVCHVDGGATWWPSIAKLPTLRYDLFDGAFEGKITAPSSTIELATEAWPLFGRYALADARFRLWTGEVGAAWGSWTQRVDARVTQQPALADGRATIAFAVDDRWLDQALLATYAGTTGIEGPAALKGIAKPLAIGAPRYAAGVLVDAINSVFQLSAYGAIGAVEATLERLLRYGPPAGDYPTFAALVAAAIPAGRWATCLASGLVRFGAPPTGQVSFLLQGDVAGPNGWARRPGAVLRRLALLSGGAGRIDDATLDALDSSRPYNLSVYLDQQTTARELLQEIAASVNAVAGVSWMGKLFVLPVAIGAPAITLAADGSALPPTSPAQQLEMAPPFAKLAITAERSWTVHPLADVAFTATLVDLGAYAAGTTYREGNIVQHQGSSWLYINPAPSAGNTPPALPAEANAFWKVLARAGGDGSSAYTFRLSNEVHQLPADQDGNVLSYSGAEFAIQVLFGAQDVTSSFTAFIADVSHNPQGLGVAEAYPNYSTYGGFDANEDTATIKYTAAGISASRMTMARLGDARELLAAVDAGRGATAVRLASRFLALTGVRLAAVRGARWGEIEDLDGPAPLWRVPAARVKLPAAKKLDASNDHLVPLSPAALELLRAARGNMHRHDANLHADGLVFAGTGRGGVIGEGAIGALYDAAGFAGRHVPHGWRATFSTVMNDRYPEHRTAIDRVLGHAAKGEDGKVAKVEAAYNRAQLLDQRRWLLERWAELLCNVDEQK